MKKKVATIILIVILLVVGSKLIYDKIQDNNKQTIIKQYKAISFEEKDMNHVKTFKDTFKNSDIIAELTFQDINTSIPIPQTTNNKYYLNHLINKRPNIFGSPFLDYRTNIDDRKLIIYGHNSSRKITEFFFLERYLSKEYYDAHSMIYLLTENASYKYKIFSVYKAKTDFRHVNIKFNSKQYKEHLKWLKVSSIYETDQAVSSEDILVLQTCSTTEKGSFIIVAAKKI